MSQREIAIQLILDEVGKGHTIDEAVQRIINRPKEQPMSDTLQEGEDQTDQHQVTKSGACVIPGCPCRGWSAQETADTKEQAMTTTIENYCIDCKAVAQSDCDERGHIVGTLGQSPIESAITHQTVARGGGEEWRVEYVYGQGYLINSDRGCLANVCDETTANQIVTEHNQHHSLVAERELLRDALQDLAECCPCQNGCAPDDMTCATMKARAVLNEQRSTSE